MREHPCTSQVREPVRSTRGAALAAHPAVRHLLLLVGLVGGCMLDVPREAWAPEVTQSKIEMLDFRLFPPAEMVPLIAPPCIDGTPLDDDPETAALDPVIEAVVRGIDAAGDAFEAKAPECQSVGEPVAPVCYRIVDSRFCREFGHSGFQFVPEPWFVDFADGRMTVEILIE